MKPMKVDDLDMAFGGGSKLKTLMPAYSTLPEEFRRERDPYSPLVNRWFALGLPKDRLKPKEGIDANEAFRHMKTIMGSFEPKHEHKIAGVAYLMSQWFDIVPTPVNPDGAQK